MKNASAIRLDCWQNTSCPGGLVDAEIVTRGQEKGGQAFSVSLEWFRHGDSSAELPPLRVEIRRYFTNGETFTRISHRTFRLFDQTQHKGSFEVLTVGTLDGTQDADNEIGNRHGEDDQNAD